MFADGVDAEIVACQSRNRYAGDRVVGRLTQ